MASDKKRSSASDGGMGKLGRNKAERTEIKGKIFGQPSYVYVSK